MTKEELRRYSSIQRELADIARRLKALEENKGCHGMAYGDTPHQRGEPLSEAQRYVEKKETLEELYRKKYRILLEAQTAVENAIESLPPELRRLMRYRYLDGMTCEQVCVEMPCSWDTFHRWHRKALAMLE
jgi:DNA-directed RNA polymerase specialized sigma24 family protein